jgi:hypothetical protein
LSSQEGNGFFLWVPIVPWFRLDRSRLCHRAGTRTPRTPWAYRRAPVILHDISISS